MHAIANHCVIIKYNLNLENSERVLYLENKEFGHEGYTNQDMTGILGDNSGSSPQSSALCAYQCAYQPARKGRAVAATLTESNFGGGAGGAEGGALRWPQAHHASP